MPPTKLDLEKFKIAKPAAPKTATSTLPTRADLEKFKVVPKPKTSSLINNIRPEGTRSESRGLAGELLKRPLERLVLEPARRFGEAVASPLIEKFGSEESKRKAQDIREQDRVVKVPLLGEFRMKGLKPENAAKQIAGETLESISWLYAPQAFLKAPFLQRLVLSGIHGAIGAGLYGTGEGLQEGGTVEESLKRGADYVPTGFVAGSLLPPALESVIGAGAGGIAGARGGRGVLNRAGSAVKGAFTGAVEGVLGPETSARLASGRVQRAEQKQLEEFQKLIHNTQGTETKAARATLKGTDPSETLVRYRLLPEKQVTNNGSIRTDFSNAYRQTFDYVEELASVQRELAAEVPTRVPLDDFKSRAMEAIRKSGRPLEYQNMINKLDESLASFAQSRNIGERGLSAQDIVDILVDANRRYDPNVPYLKSVDEGIGDAARSYLDEIMPDDDLSKRIRQEMGKLLEARKLIDPTRGGTLHNRPVAGGALTRLAARGTGAVIGLGVGGGPWGAIIGSLGADAVAQMVQRMSITNPIRDSILRSVAIDRPLVTEAEKTLVRLARERSERPRLPSPGETSAPLLTQPPTTFESGVPHQSRVEPIKPQIHTSSVYERGGVYHSPDGSRQVNRGEFVKELKLIREAGIPMEFGELPSGQVLKTNFHPDGSVDFVVSKEFEKDLSRSITERVKDFLENPTS